MIYNYIAYYAEENEFELFETFEEAEKWLIEYDSQGEGCSGESIDGNNYIAKITHQSYYEVTDKQENYHQHNDSCPEDCDEEEWPYDSDFDTVGKIKYVPVDK